MFGNDFQSSPLSTGVGETSFTTAMPLNTLAPGMSLATSPLNLQTTGLTAQTLRTVLTTDKRRTRHTFPGLRKR